jgi:hypothetical protein
MKRFSLLLLLGAAPTICCAEKPAGKPPLDAAQPTRIETATFAMG